MPERIITFCGYPLLYLFCVIGIVSLERPAAGGESCKQDSFLCDEGECNSRKNREIEMKYVISAEEMKLYDSRTMEHFGMPSCVLMERAALSVMEVIREKGLKTERVLVVCGSGNNGGDGMVLARLLFLAGSRVDLVMAGNPAHFSVEAKRQMGILEAYGIPVSDSIPEGEDYDLVADAIFGIGLSRPVRESYAKIIDQMNHLSGFKLAVDIASGISANTGQILGGAFRADLTVTFAFAKYGQLLDPGREFSGELIVKEIGITKESFLGDKPAGFYYEKEDVSLVPARKASSNKGSYGKVLSLTGSPDMAGAAYFASKAASVTGAGLVYIHTAEENRIILQGLMPEAVLKSYGEDPLSGLEEELERCNVMICGCGIGKSEKAKKILSYVLQQGDAPLILDADALNLLSEEESLRKAAKAYPKELVITPHIGEASRLLGMDTAAIKADRLAAAQRLAEELDCICVLKDAVTLVKVKESDCYVNTSGCNAMSKGGSGDALAGVIAGLIAQGMPADQAACLGVYLHGRAGQAAAEICGNYSMAPTDLIEGLKNILKEVSR